MRMNLKATGIELTPPISQYVEKRLATLDKYLKNVDPTVHVEVGKTTEHHKTGDIFKAEIHIMGGGLDIYALSEQADLYAAIDKVRDEIAQKLSHEKGKRDTLMRRGGQMVKDMMKGVNFFKRKKK